MTLKFIISLLLIGVVVMSGCIKEQVTCNKPYIKVGTECCLDQNDNEICDKDEVVTTTIISTTATTDECADLDKFNKSNCYFKKARATEDVSYCQYMESKETKVFCIALINKDSERCDSLEDDIIKKTCIALINEDPSYCIELERRDMAGCYAVYAYFKKDPTICDELKDEEMKNQCYTVYCSSENKDPTKCLEKFQVGYTYIQPKLQTAYSGFVKLRPLAPSLELTTNGRFGGNFLNTEGVTLKVTHVRITEKDSEVSCYMTEPEIIHAGESLSLEMYNCATGNKGDAYTLDVEITYLNVASGLTHRSVGTIRGAYS